MAEPGANPFDSEAAADRYAAGRPAYHGRMIERIRQRTGAVAHALDVACGTGLSTRALGAMAKDVVGVDASAAMLARAEAAPNVSYRQAAAEQLPFPDDTFELLTIASGFHWFDRDAFLPEAHRVLRLNGWLVIYEFGLAVDAIEPTALGSWLQGFFDRFPRTTRNSEPVSYTSHPRLHWVEEERFVDALSFSAKEFGLFLSSQSNAVEAIERGQLTEGQFLAEIEAGVCEFFGGQKLEIPFNGTINFLQAD